MKIVVAVVAVASAVLFAFVMTNAIEINANRQAIAYLCGAGYGERKKDLTDRCLEERTRAEKTLSMDFSK